MSELTELEEELAAALRTRAASASPPHDAWDRLVAELSNGVAQEGADAGGLVEMIDHDRRPARSLRTRPSRRWPFAAVGAAAAVLVATVLLAWRLDSSDREDIVAIADTVQPGEPGNDDRAAESGHEGTVEAAGLTVTWTEATFGANRPLLNTLVGTTSGVLGTDDGGSVWRWTGDDRWEAVPELADVHVDSLGDGRDFVLASGTRRVSNEISADPSQGGRDPFPPGIDRTTGEPVLMQSRDGRTWIEIDRSALDDVGTQLVATAPNGLVVIGHETHVAATIDGNRLTDVHEPPWDASNCCHAIDLVDFDGTIVALQRDLAAITSIGLEKRGSAWRYLGDGRWAPPVSTPISTNVAVVDDTVLMFDHTDYRCCRPPGDSESQARLLTSIDGTEWTTHAILESVTTNGLQIEAGSFFWVYGLHGFGAHNIERFGRFATLWISTDAASWTPLDISFTSPHSLVWVAGDTIFITDAFGNGPRWVGRVEPS